MKDSDIPFEPYHNESMARDLTKREELAGRAMAAYITGVIANSHPDYGFVTPSPEETAKEAVAYADALLAVLEGN